MFGLGPWEIVGILVVGLLLFGAKKLPELGRSLGQGLREFKNASKQMFEESEADENNINSPENAVRQIEVEENPAEKDEAAREPVTASQPNAD